ncbi:hypothetical protein chiPu_0020820 [Chiloscyllium punctatum]|uniref:Uncharacterized protein n=1 Tax=Chiloscyllium punctatum TaxID=137246 RepID=A0A401RK18_CHIPU|nr:hypothetical protein [Chiloscyllium punctatum]
MNLTWLAGSAEFTPLFSRSEAEVRFQILNCRGRGIYSHVSRSLIDLRNEKHAHCRCSAFADAVLRIRTNPKSRNENQNQVTTKKVKPMERLAQKKQLHESHSSSLYVCLSKEIA